MRRSAYVPLCTWILVALTACRHEPGEPIAMDQYWELLRPRLESATSDEARSVFLAEWVAANSTNQFLGPHRPLLPFYGVCGQRATVFLQLARRAGLRVRPINLDQFAGGSHAAVEVFYDGDWHYFDVTYAGYFRPGSDILSFEEIKHAPERAIQGMVVFEGTHDRWSDGRPVDNDSRMHGNYTPEHLTRTVLRASSTGTERSPA